MKTVTVAAVLALAAAGVWLALATPWRDQSSAAGEMEVTRATFDPGRISLVVFKGERIRRAALFTEGQTGTQ